MVRPTRQGGLTANRGQSDVGLDRKQWEEIRNAKPGEKLPAWARDQQGPFVPPFTRCDREEDMARAYDVFSERLDMKQRPGMRPTRRPSSKPAAKSRKA